LTSIHLNSALLYETSPKELRDGDSINALTVIGTFILVIAWVNYVNMATARSFKRANEVGVRKVVGAFRGQLVSQFLTESFLLNVIAAIIALLLVRILWHPFSDLTGWNIPINYMSQPGFWLLIFTMFFAGTLLSGFYPAIVLSSFKPVTILKGKLIKSTTGDYLRKGLVVFQFVASVFLISGSIIVYQQLSFMKTRDLGMNINETLVLKGQPITDASFYGRFESFKTEVMRIPGVAGIAASSMIPGEEIFWIAAVQRLTGEPTAMSNVTTMEIDHNFVLQYEMEVVAGRNFSQAFNEEHSILVNNTLVKGLGFKTPEEAVGQKIVHVEDTVEIVGVLGDFHQMSLKSKVVPFAVRTDSIARYYSLKLETSEYENVITKLKEPWQTFFPGMPMDYFFLDDFFSKQYAPDDRFGKVFTLFAVLAIFIASMGLLGLASFMTLQRTKEIGIRKVLGSSVSGVVLLLSKGFIQPVLIAIATAFPLAWWLMGEWLQTFPYHITISPFVFVVSGSLVIMIAFVSVSSQTLKSALAKPAETLKHE
jgi:putative ABC transport system permease protein